MLPPPSSASPEDPQTPLMAIQNDGGAIGSGDGVDVGAVDAVREFVAGESLQSVSIYKSAPFEEAARRVHDRYLRCTFRSR